MPNTPRSIIWPMLIILLILITLYMTPSQWFIPYPSLLMADPSKKPLESIYHSYWLIIYSISTCIPICLLINLSLADNHSIVLPIILLSSYWMTAIIYLQPHSHISTYCTILNDSSPHDFFIIFPKNLHKPLKLRQNCSQCQPKSAVMHDQWIIQNCTVYKHLYICQRWSAFELVKSPSQLWISPNFNSPIKYSQLGDLYHLLCF